jgi:hypothetical protein
MVGIHSSFYVIRFDVVAVGYDVVFVGYYVGFFGYDVVVGYEVVVSYDVVVGYDVVVVGYDVVVVLFSSTLIRRMLCAGYEQQDAHEFFIAVLDLLHRHLIHKVSSLITEINVF